MSDLHPIDIVNAVICAVMALRLIAYRRQGSRYRPAYSVLAYLVTLAAGAIPIGLLFGPLPGVSTAATAILNACLLVAVIGSRGNVAKLIRSPNHGHQENRAHLHRR